MATDLELASPYCKLLTTYDLRLTTMSFELLSLYRHHETPLHT